MKKILALLLAMVMVLSLTVVVMADEELDGEFEAAIIEEPITEAPDIEVYPDAYGRNGNGFKTGTFEVDGIVDGETYYNNQALELRGTVTLDGPQDTLVAYIDGEQVTFGGTIQRDGEEVELASNEFIFELDLSELALGTNEIQFYAQTCFKNGKKVTGKIHSNAEYMVKIIVAEPNEEFQWIPKSFTAENFSYEVSGFDVDTNLMTNLKIFADVTVNYYKSTDTTKEIAKTSTKKDYYNEFRISTKGNPKTYNENANYVFQYSENGTTIGGPGNAYQFRYDETGSYFKDSDPKLYIPERVSD